MTLHPSEWDDSETEEPFPLLILFIAGLSVVLAGLALWVRFGGPR